MKGYVYSGSPNGYVLVLSFRDQALPGFKHNVQIVPPSGPMFDPLDGECKDDAVTVYKPGQPASPNTRDAVWTLSDPQVNGAAFHLHDPGSVLFPHGLDGDLHQQ